MKKGKAGDEGVSVVIGAVLLLAILVAALVAFRLSYIPAAGEHAEAEHATITSRAADTLGVEIRDGARDGQSVPSATAIPMGASYPFLVPGPPRSGAVSFDPGEHAMRLESPSLTIHTRNGTHVGGGGSSGAWQSIEGAQTITDVDAVHALRVNVTDPDPLDGETVSVEVRDQDGEYAGEFWLIIERDPPDINLIARTIAPPAPGTVVFENHLLSVHQQNWPAPYWVDLRTPLFGFATLLDQALSPLTLEFAEAGLEATFVISYSEQQDGVSRTVGGGVTVEPYERSWQTGPITIDTPAEFFVGQERIVEHGAVILAQPDGATFQTEPPITFQATSSFAKANLLLPALQGTPFSVAGNERVDVRTWAQATQHVSAGAPEATLVLGTGFPDLWTTYLEDELEAEGLEAPGDYQIAANATHVTLTLTGPDGDPATRDVSLNLIQSRIQTRVTR